MTGRAGGAAQAADGLRLAVARDVPALEALVSASARSLQAATHSPAQIEAALGSVFAVDRQLIADGSYFVVERRGRIVGCGGWSARSTLFGGGLGAPRDASRLDPSRDAARIRAFFVHPAHARQGIGRLLLAASERAALAAGFVSLALVATLAGEPLYRAGGFRALERYELTLPNGLALPAVRMVKTLSPATVPAPLTPRGRD